MSTGLIRLATVCLLTAVGAFVTGCSQSGSAETSVLDSIRSSAANESRERSYNSVLGALPDEEVAANTFSTSDKSQLVVTGEVVDAVPGIGAIWDEEGGQRTDVSYDDPSAMMSIVYLKVDVDEIVSSGRNIDTRLTSDPTIITVGLWVEGSPPPSSVARQFGELGHVVMYLSRRQTFSGTKVSEFSSSIESDAWGVLESGAFIGQVRSDGSVSFPLMDEETVSALVPESGLSLANIEAAAAE